MVYLPPFDPSRSFVTQRGFRFNGRIYGRHEAFPAAGSSPPNERLLRRLYETHAINYAGTEQTREFPPREPGRSGKPIVEANAPEELAETEATLDEQADKLANRHTHTELFAKASGLKGVRKSQTKAQIARALIEAGRAGDEAGDGTA